eukprot:884136-Prymnesium_polylepis.1
MLYGLHIGCDVLCLWLCERSATCYSSTLTLTSAPGWGSGFRQKRGFVGERFISTARPHPRPAPAARLPLPDCWCCAHPHSSLS